MSMKQRVGLISAIAVAFVVGLFIFSLQGGKTTNNANATEKDRIEEPAELNAERILAPRTLGDPEAPVKIREFASLSCSHCAQFHQMTFPALKEKYIDTGKVHFTFTDFPLNGPALDASLVARCLPEKSYFKFIKYLFETQEDWAYERNYRQIITQNAKLLGGSGEKLDACLESERLRIGLVDIQQKASEQFSIRSTPTFVINDSEIIRGAQPLAAFGQIIDKIIQEEQTTE